MNKISLFFILMLFTSCSITTKPSKNDLNNGIDSVKIQAVNEKIEKHSENIENECEKIEKDSKKLIPNTLEEQRAKTSIEDSVNNIKIISKEIKVDLKKTNDIAKDIEKRAMPLLNWHKIFKWFIWILFLILLSYLGLLPIFIRTFKLLLRGLIKIVLEITNEVKGN